MKEILTATQTVSKTFGSGGSQFSIMIDTHQGGSWQLQALTPHGTWITMDNTTFASNGLWTVFAPAPGVLMRIIGGTVGASAWVYGDGVKV